MVPSASLLPTAEYVTVRGTSPEVALTVMTAVGRELVVVTVTPALSLTCRVLSRTRTTAVKVLTVR